jgi:hypothetical protein
LAEAVIQPVFDRFNFLKVYVFQLAFVQHILKQQANEILAKLQVRITATLPTCKKSG